MSETDTQTARSSSRDAHSHRLRRVFCAGRPNAVRHSRENGNLDVKSSGFNHRDSSFRGNDGLGLFSDWHLTAVNGASTHV